MTNQPTEIAIVGGGMVGGALALDWRSMDLR